MTQNDQHNLTTIIGCIGFLHEIRHSNPGLRAGFAQDYVDGAITVLYKALETELGVIKQDNDSN